MKFRRITQTLGIALLAATVIWGLGYLADAAHPDWNNKTSATAGQSNDNSVAPVSENKPNIGEQQKRLKTRRSKLPNEPIELPRPHTDGAEIAIQSAMDQLEVLWPGAAPQDYDLINPPEIEPLYVRAFTEIVAGHNDSNPIWSPTGKLIAFERSIEDKREIIISRFDGSVLQKIYHRLAEEDSEMDFLFADILDDVSYNSGISWAPDENKLVFMSNAGSGNYDLYLLPTLGEEKTIRLTDHEEKDSHPHWNPVTDRVVFVSGRTGSADIYVMDLLSRKVSKLTNGHKTYLYPQWSPDGTKIVMIYGSNENHDIFLIEDINRPTETLKALANWSYDDLRPVWSPDGQKIAFYSNYNPENNPKSWSIIVIDASGSDPAAGEGLAEKIVAKNVVPDIERGPAWMPDSKRIVYVKNSQHTYNPIYMVHIEDKKNYPIKTQTKMNHDLACSPDGTLAFRAQVEQWDHIYIARLKD